MTTVIRCSAVLFGVALLAENGAGSDSAVSARPEAGVSRLTAAHVAGPDGVVYPNRTKTGVQGGIPQIGVSATVEQFGGRADDDQDDSEALGAAGRELGLRVCNEGTGCRAGFRQPLVPRRRAAG